MISRTAAFGPLAFLGRALVGCALAGCAGAAERGPATPAPGVAPVTPTGVVAGLPAIPARDGALRLDLVYPDTGAYVATDSTFVFGSTGTGAASLTINGRPVAVQPNGAFLAFLPVPDDGLYRLEAGAGGARAELRREVGVPGVEPGEGVGLLPPPPDRPARTYLLAGSISPSGAWTVRRGELVTVRFRGSSGGRARLILPDSTVIPLVERAAEAGVSTGFMEGPAGATPATEYAATFPLRMPLAAADTAVPEPSLTPLSLAAGTAVIELVVGSDTVRAPVEANVALLEPGETRVGVAAAEREDGNTIGVAALPPGTPYHWFFQRGTRLPITGERAGEYRVRLSDDLYIWVGTSEVRLEPPSAGAVEGSVGTVRVVPGGRRVDVRIDTSERLPYHVTGTEDRITVSIFGARSRTNWIYLPTSQDVIERIDWEQASDGEYRLHIHLADPLWGWLPRWEGNDLVIAVTRPPALDDEPLEGVTIAVDAGHPPGGAIGPTRLQEAAANLAIAKRLIPMLQERGARLVETRPTEEAVGLYERERMAEGAGADLFVSIHNNAFGDGVNPFEHAGTSVLYNRPQSVGLARHLQRELLAEFGLRDLGVIHADRAVVRNTSMPSALTETMFLMIPQQEAALRDPEVQERIAEAHLRGIEAFLRERARR